MQRILLAVWSVSVGVLLLPWELRAEPAPNFNEHVASIIYRRCATCHRPGQVAPFPLLSYRDVKRRSLTIQAVLESGYMPPWKPVNDPGMFANSRKLPEQEKATLLRWIQAGCPEGPAEKKPPVPQFPDEWYLGKPDLVVKMPKPFRVPATGPDIYRSFVIPLDLPEDKWVRAVELRPSSRQVVHHALFFFDTTGLARRRDGRDGQPGVPGMDVPISGSLGGYVPGTFPYELPEGLAMPLPKGADLIIQTHFHPTGKEEVEQSELALYFADKPPTRTLVPFQVPRMFGRFAGIDIPPGEKHYVVRGQLTLPTDVELISIGGHAHYVCVKMQMTATLPDGTKKNLLQIDDWDLNWQDRYYYRKPLFLPEGTVLETVLVYDNSADNPRNPFNPPRRIRWGLESYDEMGSITVLAVPAREKDLPKLVAGIYRNLDLGYVPRLTREQRREFRRWMDHFAPERGRRIAARLFLRLDRNKDGILQREELPEQAREKILLRWDFNENGQLDPDEIRALWKAASKPAKSS